MASDGTDGAWPWWLLPLLLGLVLSAGVLLFGEFRPQLQTFYSFL